MDQNWSFKLNAENINPILKGIYYNSYFVTVKESSLTLKSNHDMYYCFYYQCDVASGGSSVS